jgi:hypothetical protein
MPREGANSGSSFFLTELRTRQSTMARLAFESIAARAFAVGTPTHRPPCPRAPLTPAVVGTDPPPAACAPQDAIFSKGTDFFLMQGDFGKLCPLWAFGFALTAASAARAGNAKANIFKGTALTALGQYGGWMIVSLLLGSRSALFDNENYILFSALAWLATGRSEVNDALSSFPAQIYLNVRPTSPHPAPLVPPPPPSEGPWAPSPRTRRPHDARAAAPPARWPRR